MCKHYSGSGRNRAFERELAALLEVQHTRGAVKSDGYALWPQLAGYDSAQRVLVTRPLARPPGTPGGFMCHVIAVSNLEDYKAWLPNPLLSSPLVLVYFGGFRFDGIGYGSRFRFELATMEPPLLFNLPCTLCAPLHPLCLSGCMTAATLHDLLLGFHYLHTVVKYVHRDLEDKHVGQADNDGRLIVFDLSTCISLQPCGGMEAPFSTNYAGKGWVYGITMLHCVALR